MGRNKSTKRALPVIEGGPISDSPVLLCLKRPYDAQESEDTGYGVGVSRSVPNRHKKETST